MKVCPRWTKAQLKAQKARAMPSPESAAGGWHPLFVRRVRADGVASVREGKIDVKPHQFLHCFMNIMVSGGEDVEP